jgi:hypothetical protein
VAKPPKKLTEVRFDSFQVFAVAGSKLLEDSFAAMGGLNENLAATHTRQSATRADVDGQGGFPIPFAVDRPSWTPAHGGHGAALALSERAFLWVFIPRFNSVFKRRVGMSPTEYRATLHSAVPM